MEIADRIQDDLRLRVLGALVPGTPENLDVLAGKVAVTTDTLVRRLRPLAAAGLVQRRSKKTVITEAGARALAEQTRHIADWCRVIVPPPPPGL